MYTYICVFVQGLCYTHVPCGSFVAFTLLLSLCYFVTFIGHYWGMCWSPLPTACPWEVVKLALAFMDGGFGLNTRMVRGCL